MPASKNHHQPHVHRSRVLKKKSRTEKTCENGLSCTRSALHVSHFTEKLSLFTLWWLAGRLFLFFFLSIEWVARSKSGQLLIFAKYSHISVMPEPGGPGGPLAPPIFGRSVNPIPTGEGRLSPPITTGTPNVFHLPASLVWLCSSQNSN